MADFKIKTMADAFSYLLIFVAGSDGELSKDEARTQGAKLAEFMNHFGVDQDGDGDVDSDDIMSAIERGSMTYFSCDDSREMLGIVFDCCSILKRSLDAQSRKAIVDRLRTMAVADGAVTKDEKSAIDSIEELLLG